MSKQGDANFLKIQTCILKVHIHCDGCKQKVKKLLQKIDGVYTVTVDAEQGKVSVSGNVDPNLLIKKLSKSGKHAELISPKINSNNPKIAAAKQTNNNGKPQNQKGGNVITGGGGVKDEKAQIQIKGLNKDVKVPQFAVQKDPKSVKFSLPPEEEGSEFDDEFDDDDYDEEEDDLDDLGGGFDDDFEVNIKNLKTKPANNGNNAMKSGGNQKKAEVPVQVKGTNGNTGKKGGADAGEGGKNGKAKSNGAPNGKNNNVALPQMGQMGPAQMGNMPPQAAVQGLPAGAVLTPGYFQGQVAASNPYQQQQYMQAMQQQQQQQRMMMMNGQDQMYPMMGYPRPPPYAMYMQPPPQNVQYTDYISDENPGSCSIM